MMNEINYLKIKESQTVELKTSEQKLPSSLFETYSSFANTKGGAIFLGIKEGNNENIIAGVSNPKSLKKDFFNAISNNTKVSVCLGGDELWKEIDVDGKTIIQITIPEAPRSLKPVYLNSNPALAYIRRNDGDYLASEQERRAMELDSFPFKMDMQPNSSDITLYDLNQESLDTYRSLFNERNPGNLFRSLDDIAFYKTIGALGYKGGTLLATNAAVLLFGNYLQIKRLFPEYNLDYRENVSHSTRWDYRLDASDLSWSGNAFDFIMKTFAHMKPLLPNPFHISDDGITENGGQLLAECVREGIVNAICNCDYLLSGGVSVIYEGDKIVFRNAGCMRLPLERALQGGNSDSRNEGVMNLLHLAKIGDKAGTGIPNIVLKMKELGYPEPIWEEETSPNKTTLTFLLPQLSAVKGMNALDKQIVSFLAREGESNVTSIAQYLNVSNATISLSLKELEKKNIVSNNGKPTKGKMFFLKR